MHSQLDGVARNKLVYKITTTTSLAGSGCECTWQQLQDKNMKTSHRDIGR